MPLTFATRRRRFLRWRTLVIVAVVAAVVGGALFVVRRDTSPPPLPVAETDTFLAAWSAGNTETMAASIDAPPANLGDLATSLVKAVPGSAEKYTRTAIVRDKKTGAPTVTYHARVDLGGLGPVEWDGTMHWIRVKVNKKPVWRIKWQPDVLYPGFETDDHLTVVMKWPARASIVAADGSPLTGSSQTVVIGLEPRRVDRLPQVKDALKQLLGVDPASVDAALHAPGVQPNFFVPVARTPYDEHYHEVIRPALVSFNGLTFRLATGTTTASAVVGPEIIGTVGDVTADRLKQLGSPYHAGMQVGLNGLEATYEKRLAGTPSAEVQVVNGDEVIRTVKRFAGQAGQTVQITIDPHTQQAAENALAGIAQPAALVAIDAPTGQVRAAVSKPDAGFDRALEGTYPPGSTFKVVTTTALLEAGNTGSTPAPCPPTITVNGRTFHNFEGEANGSLDLAHAFAISCNNAFIGLTQKLPARALTNAAESYGFNTKYDWPLNVAGGSFPEPKDSTELAAASIGQARVLASPLQMASVAAAVAGGRWRQPVLTAQPKPKSVSEKPFPAAALLELRSFMGGVTASGGTAADAGLPAGTLGKTGTAEFGNHNPPQTHAWFIGYRGNLAFAVIVEGGGVGGRVAAPLAAKFLDALG